MIELNTLYNEDCLITMKKMEDEFVDAVITDPPYGLKFMGKDWDKAVPSIELWKECLRILKPGAWCLVMTSPRQDALSQMIIRLSEAGFRTDFTSIYWTYASGFPKSMNIGKKTGQLNGSYAGFQPKPAVEVILVCMKPLSEKTYVDQALKNGKGVTWLDDCRIPYENADKPHGGYGGMKIGMGKPLKHQYFTKCSEPTAQGRFPANLLVSDDVLNDGKVRQSTGGKSGHTGAYSGGYKEEYYGDMKPGYGDSGSFSRYFDLDSWNSKTFPFLIVPKASKSEKNRGLEGREGKYMDESRKIGSPGGSNPRNRGAEKPRKNFHPTVKPLKLMRYLITMTTRQGDLVVDPFMGSGTTAIAAIQQERKFIGSEINPDYCKLAQQRIDNELNQMRLFK